MQLFSADATMFSIFFFFFFSYKKLKKPPSKVAHNRPKHFIPQPSPSHSQQPKIDFSCHKNVPPSVCSLVCASRLTKGIAKYFLVFEMSLESNSEVLILMKLKIRISRHY
jgi:hypothetical protein